MRPDTLWRRLGPIGPAALLVLVWPALLHASGGGSEGGHGAGEYLIPPTVWAILSFLVVLTILVKKLLPPIVQVMDRRAEAIRQALEAAEQARAERKALVETQAAAIEKAQAEVQAIIDEGKADAHRIHESIVVGARKDADEILVRARREIELAKQSAVDDLQKRAVDLAFDLAGRLIRKSLSPDEHQELIRERMKDFPSA